MALDTVALAAAKKYTDEQIKQNSTGGVDLSGYYTREEIDEKGFITLDDIPDVEAITSKATVAQTIALLFEESGVTEVATEAPHIASNGDSDFALKLLLINQGYVLLYAPPEDGILNYLSPSSYLPENISVFGGSIYEFIYTEGDLELTINEYKDATLLNFFRNKLLGEIDIPTKEEIVAEVLAQLPKAEEAEF